MYKKFVTKSRPLGFESGISNSLERVPIRPLRHVEIFVAISAN